MGCRWKRWLIEGDLNSIMKIRKMLGENDIHDSIVDYFSQSFKDLGLCAM